MKKIEQKYPTARDLEIFLSQLPEDQKDMAIRIMENKGLGYAPDYFVLRFCHWDIILKDKE